MTFEDDRETAVAPGASGDGGDVGGVDSSVCAPLLQQAGYDVRGATMVLRTTRGRRIDLRVGAMWKMRGRCQRPAFPTTPLDLRDRFDAAVVRPCDAYLEGLTPNPCIACNRFLKFEALQKRRRELGFDYVATDTTPGAGGTRRRDAGSFCGRVTLRPKLRAVPPHPGHAGPYAVSGRADETRCASWPVSTASSQRKSLRARTSASCPTATTRDSKHVVARNAVARTLSASNPGENASWFSNRARAGARGACGAHPLHHRPAQRPWCGGARAFVCAGERCGRQPAHRRL